MKKIIHLFMALLLFIISFSATADSVTTTTTTTVPTPAPASVVIAPGISEADQKIIAAIYDKYATSSALLGTQLTLSSENGFVTISGRVTAQSQADEAVTLAKTIIGVKDAKSEIIITTKPPATSLPQKVNY